MAPPKAARELEFLHELALIASASDAAAFFKALRHVGDRAFGAPLTVERAAVDGKICAATGSGEWLVIDAVSALDSARTRRAFETAALFVGSVLLRFGSSRLAHIDALTGIANRRTFDDALVSLCQSPGITSVSLILIDVDFFGAYNERYGHRAGDEALCAVVRAVERLVRDSDTFARYGGEEFALLIPNLDEASVAQRAERIVSAIASLKIAHEATTLGTLTISAGCATATRDEVTLTPQALVEHADKLLYRAKREGRNRSASDRGVSSGHETKRRFQSRSKLPSFIGSFVGRVDILANAEQVFGGGRLVTLTGIGGIGKTRLATELARRTESLYEHGVTFVELMPCRGGGDIASRLAVALQLRSVDGLPLEDALSELLADQHRLLIFDNCEHVIDPAAALIARLLSACPRIHVLTTSREALSLEGEQVVMLGPLAAPEAVDLFRARLPRQTESAPRLSSATIHSLCESADGIPLAIELIACRALDSQQHSFGPLLEERIATRVGASAQHPTLARVVAWSYDLIGDDALKKMFQAVSLFQSSFSGLDAADVLHIDRSAAEKMLETLAMKSLIWFDTENQLYRLSEMARAFASERLKSDNDYGKLQQRYLDRYAKIAAINYDRLNGGEQQASLDLKPNVYFEVLHAFDLACERNEISQAVELAANLGLLWEHTGRFHDALRCLHAVREKVGSLDTHLQARYWYASACVAFAMGRGAACEADAVRALALYETCADELGAGHAHRLLGTARQLLGRIEAAQDDYKESLAVFERFGYRRGVLAARLNLGTLAMDWRDDYEGAAELFQKVLDAPDGEWFVRAVAHINLAQCLRELGMKTQAVFHAQAARESFNADHGLLFAASSIVLAEALLAAEDRERAQSALGDALRVTGLRQSTEHFALFVEAVAGYATCIGAFSDAAYLLHAAEQLRANNGTDAIRSRASLRDSLRALASRNATDFEAQWSRASAADADSLFDVCERVLGCQALAV